MSIIVEIKGSKTIRSITRSKPIRKKRKPIRLAGQSNVYQKAMKCGISIFEERTMYTTDGANKANKMRSGKLPKPCWKSFDKRHKQWKNTKKGIYPSVRILNDSGKCIFPRMSC